MFHINTAVSLFFSTCPRSVSVQVEEEPDLEIGFRDHIAHFARNRNTTSQEECVQNCCRTVKTKINQCTYDFSDNQLKQITNFISVFSNEVKAEYLLNKKEEEELISLFKYSLYCLLEENWSIVLAHSFYSLFNIIDNQQQLHEVKLLADQFFICVGFLCTVCLKSKLLVAQSLLYKSECAYVDICKKEIMNKLKIMLTRLEKNSSSLLSLEEEAFVKQSIKGNFPFITENRLAMVSIIWHEYTCQVCNVQNSNFRDIVFGEALMRIQTINV